MKTLKNQLKRAFTIVELVIVIAVVAALAAILIPTFVNVLNSANESNDTVLAKNLDTSLITVESKISKTNGVYNVTEALSLVRNDGYDVSKLTPTADKADYVYNASKNRFLYYTDDFKTLAYGDTPETTDTLVIIDTDLERVNLAESVINANIQYCVYTTYDATTNVESATSGLEVWLYTESGSTVTVNLAGGTVYHYGEAANVEIKEVATESYHLYGEVEEITLEKGHVELTSSAVCTTVTSTSSTGTSITVVGTKSELNLVGTFETYYTKTSDTAETSEALTKDDFATASGVILEGTAASNPYKLSTADDIVNISNYTVSGVYKYFALTNDIDMNDATSDTHYGLLKYKGVIDLNGYSIKAASDSHVFQFNQAANFTITDSSTSQSGAIYATGTSTASQIILSNKANITLTLEGGSIYAKDCTSLSSVINIGNTNTRANFVMNGGNIYAENSTITSALISLTGTVSFTMNGGTVTSGESVIASSDTYTPAVAVYGKSTTSANYTKVIVNYGTITAYNFCIAGSGADDYKNNGTSITIGGGALNSTTDFAIYQPQSGSVTVNSGTITGGAGAIYMNRGTLNINGGELISKDTGNTGEFTSGTGSAINAVIGLAAQYAQVYCYLKGGTLTANGSAKVITVGTSSSTNAIKLSVEKITIGEAICTSYSEVKSYVELLNSNYTYNETSYIYTITTTEA